MEDSFIYVLTSFTFAVIFLFCYIRHTFTFFDRHRIVSGPVPNFPFGNVYDVLSGETSMFALLWTLCVRFKKRRRVQLGGFYLFQQPALICTDPILCRRILEDSECYLSSENRPITAAKDCIGPIFTYLRKNLKSSQDLRVQEINLTKLLQDIFLKLGTQLEPSSQWRNFKEILGITYTKWFVSRKTFYQLTIKNDGENTLVKLLNRNGLDRNEAVDVVAEVLYLLERSFATVLLTFYEISTNDEMQDELRGEIKRFYKQNSDITVENIDSLTYLQTIVAESLRKFPITPWTYRTSSTATTLGDYSIPKGLALFIPTYAIQHDSDNYTNPELFDPDRFSEENEQFIEQSNYIPYGYPDHQNTLENVCFGLVLKLLLIDLVPRFKISSSRKTKNFPVFSGSVHGLRLKNNLWLKIEPLT